MGKPYTITAVGNNPKPYQSQYGEMLNYRVRFKETGEQIIQMSQKKTTPAPNVGDVLEGSLDMSAEYGPKFKKDFKPKAGGFGGAPKDQKDIKAQMAVKAAVQVRGPIDMSKKTPMDDYMQDVETIAQGLYEMVDRVKAVDAKKDFASEVDDMKDQLNAMESSGDGIDDDLPPEDDGLN